MGDERKEYPKQVIVIRRDLQMRKGKFCSQAAHASMKVLLDRKRISPEGQLVINLTEPMQAWLNGSFTKVVVGCDSEQEILDLEKHAQELDIPCALITDNGYTEFHGKPTITALAVGPDSPDRIDSITGSLKLL